MISIACPLRLIFPCDFTSVLFSPLALFFFLNTDNKVNWTSLVAQTVKRLPAMQESRVPSLGREDSPGEGNSNPLQYSCLENPMDRGVW